MSVSVGMQFIKPPADAAAWGYTSLKFFDHFGDASTIDINGTGAPGFKWYPQSPFTGIVCAPGDFSVSNSVLTMIGSVYDPRAYGYRCRLSTRGFLGGTTYVGSTPLIQPGFYAEVKLAFEPAYQHADAISTGWPAYWFQDLDGCKAQAIPNVAGRFTEVDGFEALPLSTVTPYFAVHEWTTVNGGSGGTYNSITNLQNGPTGLDPVDFTAFNTYGTLQVPMASNGGTGLIRRYFNGALKSFFSVDYTATGPASPGATGTNRNGQFSELDTQQLVLMLDTGVNYPAHFDYVAVWGPPA